MASMTSEFGNAVPTSGRGFFGRLFDAMIEARTREAQHRVNAYLLSLGGQTLTDLGYDRATLRRGGPIRR